MPDDTADASTDADELKPTSMERLVLWHRCLTTDDEQSAATDWIRQATTRMEVAGAELMARIGGSVVCGFDVLDLEDAIELALGLIRDANEAKLKVTFALTSGDVLRQVQDGQMSVIYTGATIDRAQQLANRARLDELVLDTAAYAQASETFLFARTVTSGDAPAYALDLSHPRRRECRKAVEKIGAPPLPPSHQQAYARVEELSQAKGAQSIVLRSDSHASALDWISRLTQSLHPELCLTFGPVGGGLQPLGGLRLALGKLSPTQSQDAPVRSVLSGAALRRNDSVALLTSMIERENESGRKPWLVLARLHEIDPATLGTIAETIRDPKLDFVMFMTLSEEQNVPAALKLPALSEHKIEPLEVSDRRNIAKSVLFLDERSEVSRRVAVLGGDTPLGVLEAARTLVASGDLVHDREGFRWRTTPRGNMAIHVEALLTERTSGLLPETYRLLEAICIAPPGSTRRFIERITELDGLGDDEAALGFADLTREAWIDSEVDLGALDAHLRSALRNNMPPARAAEIHRFVAQALNETTVGDEPSFAHGLMAHHLAEGGLDNKAAEAVLHAAHAAMDCGFERMAVRLAAAAVQFDESETTRKKASQLARNLDRSADPPATEKKGAAAPKPQAKKHTGQRKRQQTESIAADAIRSAIKAIGRREFDMVERLIDTAVAAGWGRSAARRLWAVAQLAQGDAESAVRTYQEARVAGSTGGLRTREAVTGALINLGAGEPLAAVRSALDGLARSRSVGDARGEAASLLALSACYEALGRSEEAKRIADAAG